MNTTISLASPAAFELIDEENSTRYYGGDQNWFTCWWQRYTGCGPSVASNMIHYMKLGRERSNESAKPMTKERFLHLMEDIWEFVTPTEKGIPSIELFSRLFLSYTDARNIAVRHRHLLDVPGISAARPTLREVGAFLGKALSLDLPVAFLNLCNGQEAQLDEWHWVTVISARYDRDGTQLQIEILDEGAPKQIDLALWHRTTKLGGGFVYFELAGTTALPE